MTEEPPTCETCDGTGWISVDDQLVPGALIDARCPECSTTRTAHTEGRTDNPKPFRAPADYPCLPQPLPAPSPADVPSHLRPSRSDRSGLVMTSAAQFMWADFGWWTQPNGHKRLLSWNQATKELTFWPLTRWDQPIILAVITDEDEVRARLEGWADHNMDGEGLAWLARRLEGCR